MKKTCIARPYLCTQNLMFYIYLGAYDRISKMGVDNNLDYLLCRN